MTSSTPTITSHGTRTALGILGALVFVSATLLSGSVASAQLRPQGYHPHAAPYPYPIAHGQPAAEWMNPEWGQQDYGGTCCGPHWYDFSVEALYLKRAGSGISNRIYASQGIAGFGPPNAVLTGDNFDFDFEPAIRVSARVQLNAVTNIEANYMDALNFRERVAFNSANDDLYSPFSSFGDVPLGGFEETDQASRIGLLYDSDLDTVDINIRHGWTTPSQRISGSWLVGVRYLRLYEQFQWASNVSPHVDPINMVNRGQADFQYDIFTRNEMVGPQIGFELTGCVMPGIQVVTEAKAGVMVNFAELDASLVSSIQDPDIQEAAQDDDAAFVSEMSAYLLYQIHPLWKIRAGYMVMFMDGAAIASENFNELPGFLNGTPRSAFISTNGSALIHGATVGVEFGW